jgi:hypothetical protein
MTVSVAFTNMCDGYDVDDASVLKFTEARGVDIHKLGAFASRMVPASVR